MTSQYHEREAIRDMERLYALLATVQTTVTTAEEAKAHRDHLEYGVVLIEHLVVTRLGGQLHEQNDRRVAGRDLAVLQARLNEVVAMALAALPATPDTDTLANEVHPAVSEALALATELHRMLDPEAAQKEDWDAELATPMRYRTHPRACDLKSCPYCGAALYRDDRTFTGSYCEACRTRWDLQES